MKGLFDTAKNMAVFMRVLLLTFALQCVFGAVGYAQENPTGGDQGAPSCSSGECASGDSCQCLKSHFNLCDDQVDEAYAWHEGSDSSDSSEPTQILLVDEFDAPIDEIYKDQLEALSPGDKWLVQELVLQLMANKGINRNINSILPPRIITARRHPEPGQAIGKYDSSIISTMQRLKYVGDARIQHPSDGFVTWERDQKLGEYYVLDFADKYCYYKGWFTDQATSLRRQAPDKSQEFPRLKLMGCIPKTWLPQATHTERMEGLSLPTANQKIEFELALGDTVVSLIPILGTADLIQRKGGAACSGDLGAAGEICMSLAGEIPFLAAFGKGMKLTSGSAKLLNVCNAINKTGTTILKTEAILTVGGIAATSVSLFVQGEGDGIDVALLGVDVLAFVIGDDKIKQALGNAVRDTYRYKRSLPEATIGCVSAACGTPLNVNVGETALSLMDKIPTQYLTKGARSLSEVSAGIKAAVATTAKKLSYMISKEKDFNAMARGLVFKLNKDPVVRVLKYGEAFKRYIKEHGPEKVLTGLSTAGAFKDLIPGATNPGSYVCDVNNQEALALLEIPVEDAGVKLLVRFIYDFATKAYVIVGVAPANQG